MRIFEALVSELRRLESLDKEQWMAEMTSNENLGILIFAALEEIETIASCSVKVPVFQRDIDNRDKVNAIIDGVLSRES